LELFTNHSGRVRDDQAQTADQALSHVFNIYGVPGAAEGQRARVGKSTLRAFLGIPGS